jgi:8-oxo-dGTP pyrophosphatase MutT (NUDIX family)
MNSFNIFCEEIRQGLKKRMPGDASRKKMAPSIRMPENGRWCFDEDPIESAVCILLFPSENKIFFPLIKRAGGIHSHGGQISLPGGKYEDADENLMRTALRETYEEIGIRIPESNVLGRLSLLYVPVSDCSLCGLYG